VASLPLGANVDGDGCLTIRFLGAASEVPGFLRLVVTRVSFDPQVIAFGGSGCSGRTRVCGAGLVLTETGDDECFASVRSDPGAVGTKVKVQVAATVDCTGGRAADCARYKEQVDSDKSSEDLGSVEVPEPNEPETTPTDEAPSTSSDSDSDSGSGTTSSS